MTNETTWKGQNLIAEAWETVEQKPAPAAEIPAPARPSQQSRRKTRRQLRKVISEP